MLSIFGDGGGSSDGMGYRLARIEKKLDMILKALDLSWRDPLADEVQALLKQGRKIEAIKLYRERTGAGLKEAKEAVESIGAGR
jgi:hypothetical protein